MRFSNSEYIFRKELKAGTAADTGEHVSVPVRFTIDQ